MARWIAHGFTGCAFAQSLINNKHLSLNRLMEEASPERVDDLFEVAADEEIACLVVFPLIRSEEQLLSQLKRLQLGERWSIGRASVPELQTEDLLLNLQWRTRTGLISTPMGFGPFPTMPVTRRAPYPCIATWPSERCNPHRRRPREGFVDFLDSKLPRALEEGEYRHSWDDSVERTTAVLAELHDHARYYRDVSFRLSRAAAAHFFAT